MNEGTLKTKLKHTLLQVLPGAVVWNHTGAFTSGIPDLSCSWGGTTSWIEVKYSPVGRRSRPTPLQVAALKSLAAAGVPAYLLEYREVQQGRAVELSRAQPDGTAVDSFVSYGAKLFDHEGVAMALRTEHEKREAH